MTHGRENGRSSAPGVFERFFHSEASSAVVLLACAVAALVLANSPWSEAYFRVLHTKVGVSFGEARFALSVQHVVNDLLMAVFFFVVGLEIKRELVVGQLSSFRKAVLPVAAAAGGMIVPALLYTLFNRGGEGAHGWGIPMATDIAFALGVLSLFGRRIPLGLKVFLTALAIADDLGAVLVIALFYTHGIRLVSLAVAGGLLVLIGMAGLAGVKRTFVFTLLALGVWAAVLGSGIHATVAGVLVAFLVPVRAARDPRTLLDAAEARVKELRAAPLTRHSMVGDRSQMDAISDLHAAAGDLRPAGLAFETELHPVVAFLILPLFALCNAGVAFEPGSLSASFRHPVSLGVLVGLVLGKQIGILLFTWLAVKTGRAALPEGVGWVGLYGAACLAGIGFTMSLFVAELAFRDPALGTDAKVGIFGASLLAAAWGAIILSRLPASRRG